MTSIMSTGLIFLLYLTFISPTHGKAAKDDNFIRATCPHCDSSVFSYCTDKLLHDACCCLNPFDHQLPLECKLADCSFLHANSCRDHHLITRCCCNKHI